MNTPEYIQEIIDRAGQATELNLHTHSSIILSSLLEPSKVVDAYITILRDIEDSHTKQSYLKPNQIKLRDAIDSIIREQIDNM